MSRQEKPSSCYLQSRIIYVSLSHKLFIMGKREKEHRKKVQARNNKIKQNQQSFMKKFKERFGQEMELEKQRMMAENPNYVEPNPEEDSNLPL